MESEEEAGEMPPVYDWLDTIVHTHIVGGDPALALASLGLLKSYLDTVEGDLVAHVRAHNPDVSWSQIGTLLRMSKQGAWEKHHDRGTSPRG